MLGAPLGDRLVGSGEPRVGVDRIQQKPKDERHRKEDHQADGQQEPAGRLAVHTGTEEPHDSWVTKDRPPHRLLRYGRIDGVDVDAA